MFVVLLSDALGEHALKAAGQRALAPAIGIGLAALAISAWPNIPVTPQQDSAAQ